MKNALLLFIFFIAGLIASNNTYAAFAVPCHPAAAVAAGERSSDAVNAKYVARPVISRVAAFFQRQQSRPHGKRSGWPGITALCCAVFIVIWPLNSLLAVIFGIIGLGKKYNMHGLAIAGLVLGVVGLAAAVLLAAILASGL